MTAGMSQNLNPAARGSPGVSGPAFETFKSISRYNLPMSPSAQRILEEARQLPPDEVTWLIESLLHVADGSPEAETEAAWDSEIKRRLDEIDSGAVEMIPEEQVLPK
jgi:putative addiction module component (TIGR02574 family)